MSRDIKDRLRGPTSFWQEFQEQKRETIEENNKQTKNIRESYKTIDRQFHIVKTH